MKISRRDAAKILVNAAGESVDPIWDCSYCPFYKTECSLSHTSSQTESSCLHFCAQWLKDNPEEKAKIDKTITIKIPESQYKKIIAEWRERGELVFDEWLIGDNPAVTTNKFHSIYASHEAMLLEKNKRYGDSALTPVKVFAPHLDDVDSILIRLDDKISRIRNSEEIRKNDVSDLMGYCVLLCKAKGWEDFMDQID